MGISTWRDSKMGLPLSRVSSVPNSSLYLSTRSPIFQRIFARSAALISAQGPEVNAARAAATAASASGSPASASIVSVSPVAGFIGGKSFAGCGVDPLAADKKFSGFGLYLRGASHSFRPQIYMNCGARFSMRAARAFPSRRRLSKIPRPLAIVRGNQVCTDARNISAILHPWGWRERPIPQQKNQRGDPSAYAGLFELFTGCARLGGYLGGAVYRRAQDVQLEHNSRTQNASLYHCPRR